jgi:hypothetical protein
VCCVRDTHHWTNIFWLDCQQGSVHEHFKEFCSQLTEGERRSYFFQQDGATFHTSGVLASEFITSSLWDERLAKICGRHVLLTLQRATFFLRGHLKSTVYELNPHTIQKLKDISHAVAAVKSTILLRVFLNNIRREQLCVDAGENHF